MQTAKSTSTTMHNLHHEKLAWGSTVYSFPELKHKKRLTTEKLVADILEISILELK